MKILIVSALSWELKPIKDKIKQLKLPIKINFLTTWMWNYNMILNLQEEIIKNKYDFLINIWSCWYKNKKEDLIQIARIFNITNQKELLVPIFFKVSKLESIFCSEKIVSKLDEWFVDMESYWFELVASKYNIPRLILKIPVDEIWNNFDKNIYIKKLNKANFEDILKQIIDYLKSTPKKENFDIFFNELNLTFSQKIIFKRLYYKYSSLIWNFDIFFNENKNLWRKDFLKLLEEKTNV